MAWWMGGWIEPFQDMTTPPLITQGMKHLVCTEQRMKITNTKIGTLSPGK